MILNVEQTLAALGVSNIFHDDGVIVSRSPIDGIELGKLRAASVQDGDAVVERARAAFAQWRTVPAPRRGELVRLIGEELRANKVELGRLVSLEAGKILSEGLGEVQEMIDICEFATGLSRQLYGLTMTSERSNTRMMETWHPAGPCLVITAFNFPVAVWAWNAALALVCGDSVIWKPSEKTPLTGLAVQALFEKACAKFGPTPPDLNQVVIGGRELGAALVANPGVTLVSATGSTAMGRAVSQVAAQRFARTVLELGGNNASIVCPSADLELVRRAVAFAAVGTAGQRCTSLRRLLVHRSVYSKLVASLKSIYQQVNIGNPLEETTIVGPLIDQAAFDNMERALSRARAAGGLVFGGGRVAIAGAGDAHYVRPAIVEMEQQLDVVREETFAPILYIVPFDTLDQAIAMNNAVAYGLSSSIFTTDLREMEIFLSSVGSDCGIANVNMGPSGAEIGGAFGGEKDTGGGRESGSDAWKVYMRRATNAINFGRNLPLAQGVKFDV